MYDCDNKGYILFTEGLTVHNRYRLEKRIGKGTFSKVFAAVDLEKNNWVAIKIVRNTDKYKLAAKVELSILKLITSHEEGMIHGCSTNCIQLLNHFTYNDHPCFVFELLGRNLYTFTHANRYMPFAYSHVKNFVSQMLEALCFLHSQSVIYADMKPENVVFVYDSTVKKKIHDVIVEIPKDTRVKLIDFGSSLYADRRFTHLVQTRHYRAPEVVLGIPWSKEIDIWSLGCLIIELITGRMVFNTHCSIDHLNQMDRLIGPMPEDLRDSATKYANLFNEDGSLQLKNATISKVQCMPLAHYFERLMHTEPSMKSLMDLVEQMLQWRPESRIKPNVALQHAYFH